MHLTPGAEVALAGLSLAAGAIGALVGIGGGVILVPSLVLLFDVDIRAAVAASLVAVVATSSAAGSIYVGSGAADMRLGMTLEIATTLGGITGGLVAAWISPRVLSAIFGVMMGVTAALMLRGRDAEGAADEGGRGGRAGEGGEVTAFRPVRLWLGLAISLLAGIASGMLGVGGGFLKVPAMALGMRVPFKVAAATSNFMIGVTAASSLFVYFARGDIRPGIIPPSALGVGAGALLGTALVHRVTPRALRWILAIILALVGAQMAARAFGVQLGR